MSELRDINSITIAPNRQRRDFDPEAIQELIASIQESAHGLMHPIVVREEDGVLILVAGERRLRAIKEINELGGVFMHGGLPVPKGQVPIVHLGSLSGLAAFEAELEENIRRKDLTVIEAAQATARLFELRSLQAEEKGLKVVTTGDIAREIFDIPASVPSGELGQAQSTVRNQLLIAKHAANPEVRKAKSLKEAVNIVKKADAAATSAKLAAAVGKDYGTKNLKLFNADCLAYMQETQLFSFDILLTDPPYGMGAHEFGDSNRPGDMKEHSYDDSYEAWLEIMQVFPAATFALAKASAHAYVFCDIDRFPELRERMSAAGWKVHRTPLVWHNPDGFRTPWPDQGPQRKYELILYAVKGDRKTTRIAPDVLSYRKDAQAGHPAQKPVELLRDLLQRSAVPGDMVFDPFAGSGATLEAAHGLLLDCVGVEKDSTHYGTALKRIQALSALEPGLF